MSIISGDITFLILGNCLYGLINAALTVCVGQIANKWFADSERTISSSLMMSGAVYGSMIAAAFAMLFLRGEGEEFKEGFCAISLVVNLLGIVLATLAILFIESAPSAPPSGVGNSPETPLPSVGSVFVQLWQNKNLLLLTVVFALSASTAYVYSQLGS